MYLSKHSERADIVYRSLNVARLCYFPDSCHHYTEVPNVRMYAQIKNGTFILTVILAVNTPLRK